MKEYQLRQGLCKTIAFSFCVCASVAGLFSCDSDRLNGGGSIGKLSLNLAADTANIKGGTLSTKTVNVLADFEDVDNYTVQIFQGSDTLKSALYKDFPGELEIKEGAYTLRASKGANLPAAFDNPYFEGSTDFVVKKDMKTPLEVTCTMANARIYAEYSEDFLKAYSDYSVSLKTSSMDDVFTISKGETRGAYLQVAKEGTPLSIAITLMRENWEKPEVYTVTDPTITLKPKESVLLKFSTDGKTGDGLDLSIELDDSMEEADLEFGIPDFMWKPFTDLHIWACGFENNMPVEMNVTNGYPSDSCTIKAEVPGRIKECWVVRLEDGEKIDSVDIATAGGLNTAENVWGLNTVSSPIAGVKGLELDLKGAFNKIYASDIDKIYGFSVYVNDALNVMHTSDVITASVNLKAAKVPTVGNFELAIPSKHSLEKDTAIAVMAEAGIKTLTLKVSKDGAAMQYNLLADNSPEGIYYDKQKHKVIFKKECSSQFESKETEASTYSYELSVTDNLDRTVTKTSTLTVTPVFTIVVPEGDVWAKRATFHIKEDISKYPAPVYQVLKDGQWQDVEGNTATGLPSGTKCMVRAFINNWPTGITEFTTEDALQVPNGDMEQWSDWTLNLFNGANVLASKVDVTANQPNDTKLYWATVNQKTFGSDPNIWSTYSLVPSTQKTTGRSGNGALIRTVGWDNNLGNAFYEYMVIPDKCYHVAAGKLFVGSYDYKHKDGPDEYNYGKPFTSRPTGIRYWNKYVPVKDDKYKVWAIVENRDNGVSKVLARAEMIGGAVADYTKQEMKFEYINTSLKATHLTIVFASSSKCNDDEVTETKALKGGSNGNAIKSTWYLQKITSAPKHYEGSNLYIDDVELIYE